MVGLTRPYATLINFYFNMDLEKFFVTNIRFLTGDASPQFLELNRFVD